MSQTTSGQGQRCRSQVIAGLMMAAALVGFTVPVSAQTAGVCEGKTCENLPTNICDAGGFKVTQKSYTPASQQNSGTATYTYEICSPAAGVCTGSLRAGESCLDNSFCQTKGRDTDPDATCTRECAVSSFRELSHFDIFFPELGVASCVSAETDVTGSCAITTNTSGTATVGNFDLGDGSIENVCGYADPDNNNNADKLAKCEETTLAPGDCLTMTLNIAGETNSLGLGTAVVLSKESTDCNASCIAGPSCEGCQTEPPGDACLTRTLGFWGTHPWITNNYATDSSPVSVCWKSLDCDDPDDGKSNPSCKAGSCDSVMEGLGSAPGIESPTNQPYVSMVKQLTAAKLNLAATKALLSGASCSSWTYQGKTIEQWIDFCEGVPDGLGGVTGGYCYGNKSQISNSGCIEALNAFNNSEDTGFLATPAPFDRPSVDDAGNVSGADPTQFGLAQGNSTPPGKWVIGKNVGGNDCR